MSRDRLNIDKDNRIIYKTIQDSEGDLKKIPNTELFFLAVMFGKYCSEKREEIQRQEGYIREQSLSKDDWHILKALAVDEKKEMDVLLNKNEMFKIAEEYANSGIKRLNNWYFEQEHIFIERAEEFLIGAYNDQKIGE